jgi:hypothetical protein
MPGAIGTDSFKLNGNAVHFSVSFPTLTTLDSIKPVCRCEPDDGSMFWDKVLGRVV